MRSTASVCFRLIPVGPDGWASADAVFRASVQGGCTKDYSPCQIAAWLRRATPARWHELLSGNLFFFRAEAAATGEAAGLLSVSSEGYVHSLFVHPRYSGMGLGKQMLCFAERLALAGGASDLRAEVSLTAKALFEKCGFTVVSRQCVVLDGCGLENYVMRRSLSSAGTAGFAIRPVWADKKHFLDLLLQGDEQESAVDAYLERGRMYVLEVNGKPVAVCVVTDEGNGMCEVKNLAVSPVFQRRGYGRRLLRFAEECSRGYARTMQVGTGESPLTLPFYERCGYSMSHRIPHFFLTHYNHPVYDGGRRLDDMIYLKKSLADVSAC